MPRRFNPLTYLQTINDEEAKTIVENEQLILIPDMRNKTGFWRVSEKKESMSRPYVFRTIPEYGLNTKPCFKSKIAAAVYISQHLGRSVCRSITTWYEDESESQILTNIRIPNGLKIPNVEINGQTYGGRANYRKDTWRYKTKILYISACLSTKFRNCEPGYGRPARRRSARSPGVSVVRRSPPREHTFDWTLDEFRSWFADTLKMRNFKCAYSCKKLTKDTVSLERLDETKGYSPENCVLIDIHFQTGGRQWSHEKFLSVYELRNTDTYHEHEVRETINWNQLTESERRSRAHWMRPRRDQQHATELYKIFKQLRNTTKASTKLRNSNGCNHEESEITIEYLIELWEKQRGRCYYLNVPMNTCGEWQVSVERIDESKGYTKDNIVLTTLETQNAYAQWSKEFVENVWN